MKVISIKDILYYLDKCNINYTYVGEENLMLEGFSSLKNYKNGTFTWVKEANVDKYDLDNKTLIITSSNLNINSKNVIYSNKAKYIFFELINNFFSTEKSKNSIGQGTIIGQNVKIGKNVVIGCNCVLEGEITIEDDVIIHHNVTIINRVSLGSHSEIQSGTIIGHDGFGWCEVENKKKKMIKHYGGVLIEDDVYIGPNCVIDRATIDNTIIKKGTKIDGNCFIAHNVEIGENAILIAGTKLYGSSTIGNNAYIASAIVRNQISIGNSVTIGMGSVVTKDIPNNVTAVGVPAKIIS